MSPDGDSGDSEDDEGVKVEGAYDPADYQNLAVSSDIKELFTYITRYTPQSAALETKLKPFIPDFIPAVGDIDAMIKINRVDRADQGLGLQVLDEPCAAQSDPAVLDLQLRAISKTTTTKAVAVKQVGGGSGAAAGKAIDSWIGSITELHREKPPQSVSYSTVMPEIETLMQEWPTEFEELLGSVRLPTAELNCTLKEYVHIVCSICDIPIHKSRVESLHLLFTLFSEFKNSQHFRSADEIAEAEAAPAAADVPEGVQGDIMTFD
jgi:intraflagellar transport protein 46